MGPAICCVLFFNLFSPNLPQSLEKPIIFLESLFTKDSLPTQTRKTKSYTIALVGDSMTETMGTADPLHQALKQYYPNNEFGILNFGIGATNILSIPDRLIKESQKVGGILPSVLSTRPDIIFLESMGNNPLSEYPLDEGLKKQTEALDKIVNEIKQKSPKTVLVFVATIAPSKQKYATGVTQLSPEERENWANERIAYIQNHINYAKSHNIPLIDIFDNSLENGDGNLAYINSSDYIHPSSQGIQFISQSIADFVFTKKVIPN